MGEAIEDYIKDFGDALDNNPLVRGLYGYIIIIALDCTRAKFLAQEATLGVRLAESITPLAFLVLGYYFFGSFNWLISKIVLLFRKFKEISGGWVPHDKSARVTSDAVGGPPT